MTLMEMNGDLSIKKYYRQTAANERFHASGGVPRWKVSGKQQVKWLVASVLNPRLREAATTLAASLFGQCTPKKADNDSNCLIINL